MQEPVMDIDLTASELLVVTLLAFFGNAVLQGDREAMEEVSTMLLAFPDGEAISAKALEKLEAGIRLAKRMMLAPEELS